MMPYHLRPFRPADQPAARALILAGLAERFGVLIPGLNPDVDDITRHYLEQGHGFIVAECAGVLVGTGALLVQADGVGQLVRISVAPAQRRRGLGQALVRRLCRHGRERGLRRLVLETNEAWPDAIRLYQRCGFTIYDHRDGEVHLCLTL
ncbi:MAG: GNAT family N-acetyltransferase [Anaerolineales bacterium]|nr:GNAT family N-acetyltransferase [Anaerolineales bacterium]MCB8953563.1 GNAT family N-acetyltransferase [Ardenticatenales bacterium]